MESDKDPTEGEPVFGKVPAEEGAANRRDDHEKSFLQSGVLVRGEIEAQGDLRIDGTMRGSVKIGKTLILGSQADVDGFLTGQEVVIHGRFTGLVIADQRVRLAKGARVRAELYCTGLAIEDDVFFLGRSHMGEAMPDRQAAREAALRRLNPPQQRELEERASSSADDRERQRLTLLAVNETAPKPAGERSVLAGASAVSETSPSS